MIIRDAVFKDLGDLLPLAHEAHSQSVLADIDMNDAIVQRNFVTAIEFDDGYAKVVEHNGKVVGGLVGIIIDNHFGIRCATDLFMFSRGGTDKLIADFKTWAETRAARFIQITDLSGNHRYHKLVEAIGLHPGGTNFIGVT